MQFKGPKTKQRPTAYSLLLPPVAVVMAGVIGWPVFWYVKSRQTAAAVTAWTTHEGAARPRVVLPRSENRRLSVFR